MNDATGQPGQSSSGVVYLWQYTDVRATTPMRALALDVDGLRQAMADVYESADRAGQVPLWSGAELRPGTTRANENVERIWTLVCDLDDNTPLPVIRKWLGNLTFAAYPTYHWTAERERWRVILPLDEPIPVAEYGQVWRQVNEQLFLGHLDPSTKDPARMHWLPCRQPGALLPESKLYLGGVFTRRALAPLPQEPVRLHVVPPVDLPSDQDRRRVMALISTECESLAGAAEGQRHNTLLQVGKLGGGYVAGGLIAENWLVDQLLVACERNGLVDDPQENVERTISDSISHGKQHPLSGPPPDRPFTPPSVSSRLGQRYGTIGSENGTQNGATTTAPLSGSYALPGGARLFDADAWLALQAEEPAWRAAHLLMDGSVALLYGKPKLGGKTTLLLHMADAVAGGEPWLGLPTQQSVVVMLTEQGDSLRSQIRRARLKHLDGIKLLPIAEMRRSDMDWATLIAETAEWAANNGAHVLLVDTLAAFANLDDENDSVTALRALRVVQDAAAQYHLAILIVHHARKMAGDTSDTARGSSGITGAVDMLLSIEADELMPMDQRRQRTLHIRSRIEEWQDLVIELDYGHGYRVIGSEIDAEQQNEQVQAAFWIDTLNRPPGEFISITDVLTRCHIKPSRDVAAKVRAAFNRARREGHVESKTEVEGKRERTLWRRTALAVDANADANGCEQVRTEGANADANG